VTDELIVDPATAEMPETKKHGTHAEDVAPIPPLWAQDPDFKPKKIKKPEKPDDHYNPGHPEPPSKPDEPGPPQTDF